MNPAKANHIATQEEETEPIPMPVVDAMPGARTRQLLILGIALLAAWIAMASRSAIKEINTDLEEIRARFELPIYSRT